MLHVLRSFQFYGYAVIQILIEPRLFFKELPGNTTWVKSLGFCMICSTFYVFAGILAGSAASPVKTGAVFFLISTGLMLLSSGLSYLIMVMTLGKKSKFELILNVYAFSSGVILLVSWMSVFLWVAEPWKWWLIFTGFKTTCNLSGKQSIVIILIPMVVHIFLLHSLLAVA